jgi:hypothetical protein
MKLKYFALFAFIVIVWQSNAQTASLFPFDQQNYVGNTGGTGVINV